MTECTEVADNMAKAAPHFATPDDALAWVKQRMPDETLTVRENVARSLYERQMPTPPTTPTPLSARLATMAEQLRGLLDAALDRGGELNQDDLEELCNLPPVLTAASADAAKLEGVREQCARICDSDGSHYLARCIRDADDTTPTDREPDRDTDQHGNTWRNADGSPVRGEG